MRYGLWLSVEIPQIKGTSTGLEWKEIGEVPDAEGVKEIVKKNNKRTALSGIRQSYV